MKRIGALLLLALLLALMAGCGGTKAPAAATPAPEKAATEASSGEPSPTEPADTTSAVLPTEAPAATAESAGQGQDAGDTTQLSLPDEETTLKTLKSYKSTWSFEWTGKKDGKDQVVKWLTAEQYTSDPRASYTKFESSDSLDPSQAGSMELYQIGSKSYMVSNQAGKTSCTAFSSEDSTPSGSFLSRGAFGSISSGKLVGEETVNGVKAKHYKYDESATGMKMFTKLTGDVWVAVDGEYVVKDEAQWEGTLFGLLGGGSTTDVGTGSWTSEVTDINQPFEITPPQGCENAAESLPAMADATELTSFGAMTTYKTSAKLAEVVKFYKDEMVKAGWKEEGDGMTSDELATLNFTKDGKKAGVVLTTDSEKTSVMITVE